MLCVRLHEWSKKQLLRVFVVATEINGPTERERDGMKGYDEMQTLVRNKAVIGTFTISFSLLFV